MSDPTIPERVNGPQSPGEPAPDLEVFPPTLREVMLRPQWIGLLLVCLVVAGVFAWLGQWQLGRAIATAPPPPGSTEQVRPIDEVAAPGEYLPEPLVGQKVSVGGWWIGEDFLVVESRYNDGDLGYWVTGQLRLWDGTTAFGETDEGAAGDEGIEVTEPVSLAVAIGWAPTREEADAAAAALEQSVAAGAPAQPLALTGRLVSDEGPALPPEGADPQTMTRMSSAALLGQWHDVEELAVYRPHLISDEPAAGLTAISSPPPTEGSGVNWLNIFYAAEWAIFAGFAFYLWYRLARDAWEKELEDLEDAGATASGPPPVA